MLFDLSYLTERALEELVSRGIEKREYIIDEDDKDRANKYLLIGVYRVNHQIKQFLRFCFKLFFSHVCPP